MKNALKSMGYAAIKNIFIAFINAPKRLILMLQLLRLWLIIKNNDRNLTNKVCHPLRIKETK